MPELPEVEYTARQLRANLVGATIRDALVFWDRTIGYPAPSDFLHQVAGMRITGVRRRGKFLLIDLSPSVEDKSDEGSGWFLSIHRRMTGNLLLLPPGWEIDTSLRDRDPLAWDTKGPAFRPLAPEAGCMPDGHPIKLSGTFYCRVCFNLTDGRRLLYTDPRKFGRIELWPREREGEVFAGLGLEPLGEAFTVEGLHNALSGRKGAIKQVLLDQQVVAGLGNIYADEALFYASIHPLRRADTLSADEIKALHQGIISALTLGIEHGGTSFNDYRDLWGEAGDNYDHVQVYQRDGEPCVRCGTIIERIVVAQRSTHFCPNCQRLTVE